MFKINPISQIQNFIPSIKNIFTSRNAAKLEDIVPTKFDMENKFFQDLVQNQQMKKEISPEALKRVMEGPYQNLSEKFLSSLSEDAYKQCLKYAQNSKMMSEVKDYELSPNGIAQYSELVLNGIKRCTKGMPFKFVGLGQSPAAISRYFELKGQDVALVPGSEMLLSTRRDINQICRSEKYFDYLKKFGFDAEHPDKDKVYVLCDYTCSGKSLDTFFLILRRKLPYKVKILCQSLQDFASNNPLSCSEKEFTKSFEDNFLYTEKLKYLYSPIFRLPYNQVSDIEKIHNESLGSNKNVRCNKLFVLWFDKMFKKGDYIN